MEDIFELSVEELGQRWEWLRWNQGIDELKITETFPNNGMRSFIVCGLSMEIEDSIVCCYDNRDIIIDNFCALMMFLKEHLLSIHISTENGWTTEILKFKNGTVLIEKVA